MTRPSRRRVLLLGTALHGALGAVLLSTGPALADPHPDFVQPAPVRPARMASVQPSAAPYTFAAAAEVTHVRAADHPGYSRVVFDFPDAPGFAVTREGNRVVARFTGAGAGVVPGLAARLRYVDGVEGGAGWGAIDIAHGAQIRIAKLDKRVVIDILPPEALPGVRVAEAASTPPTAAAPVARPKRPKATARLHPPHPPAAPMAATQPPAQVLPANPTPSGPARETPDVPAPAAAPREKVAVDPPAPAPAVGMPPPDGQGPGQLAGPPTPPTAPAPPRAVPPTNLAAAAGPGHAIILPFAETTGAAAFRRGDTAVLVFDERRSIDVAALQDDSVFAAATIQMLPGATMMRVKLDSDMVLRLTRVPSGWGVAAVPGPGRRSPIAPLPIEGDVSLPAAQPGQVVTVPDPDTGWNLLVGTQMRPGQGLAVARRSPAYVLLPTWQGVAVEPRSDRLGLRQVTDGFLLSAPGQDLDVPSVQAQAQVMSNAASLTRRFDFPDLPDTVLLRRMNQMIHSAAAEPRLARYQARRDAAQAMIALGLGAEAGSLLQVAATDDPQHADDPDLHGLSAVAALLADRPAEADGLDDPALTGTDEIALWRAVRAARLQEGSPEAAPVFAATMPLLLSYPDALRERLLPLAAETMATGGAADAAGALLAGPEGADPNLAYAAALLEQVHGDVDGALAKFDAVAASTDQRQAARAARRAVEVRLAAGRITPLAAADALSRQFLAWRGDGTELGLRLRSAALYAQAGAWRRSIDMLHETTAAFADDRPAIRRQMAQTFTAMLQDAAAKERVGKGDTAINSLDLVTLVDENPDLIPPGPDGDVLAGLLADRLLALDLPRRAAPVLDKLMRGAPTGAARAGLGARLAQLKLQEGDGAAAAVALSDSAADDLPAPLVETRTLLAARSAARQGDPTKALATLAGLATPGADELRAQLLTDAKDWPGAEAALADLVTQTLPPDGALTDAQQNLVLRLAGAAAQAGDEPALKDMAGRLGPRMANKQLSDMFRLLTGGPVAGMADMPRVAGDIARARALPSSLSAIKPN